MSNKLDLRQTVYRGTLGQIGNQTNPEGDNLLNSVNNQLTPLLKLSANNPASLVVNVGASDLLDSETNNRRAIPHIGRSYVQFTSGTITFPATSGGNIVCSPGGSTVLTVPSGNYAAVLICLDKNGNLRAVVGNHAATETAAINNLPNPISNTLAIGFIVVRNVSGTIQNITQSNIRQFGVGQGGGADIFGEAQINNNQTSPANVTDFVVDSAENKTFKAEYSLSRIYDAVLYDTTLSQSVAGNNFKFVLSDVRAIATDSLGNIYVGGAFRNYQGKVGRDYLVKFNSSGVLDTTFMANAVDGGKFNGIVLSIAIDSSNNVYVGGEFMSYAGTSGRNRLVKFNSSGVLDTTFMTSAVDGGKFSDIVRSIAIDSSNNVYVGGSFTSYAGTSGRNYLVKFNSSGTLDTTFMTSAVDGSKFNNAVESIAADSSGNVYVGGWFANYAGTSGRDRLVKFNSSGILDATFMTSAVDGSKFSSIVNSIAIDSSNNVYVGGFFTSYAGTSGRNYLVKFNSSGTLDTTFTTSAVDGSKFNNTVYSIAIDSSNNVYVGGVFVNYAGTSGRDRLVKFNSSGVLDTTFMTSAVNGSKFNNPVLSIAIDSADNVYVGGEFTNYAGTFGRSNFVSFLSNGTIRSSFVAQTTDSSEKIQQAVRAIAIDSAGNIYVGGNFTNYAGTSGRNYLVKFNSSGVLDTTFMANAVDGSKFNGAVYSIAIDSSNNVYVGGGFASYAGTSGRNCLVKFNSSGVLDTTFMANAVDGGKFNSTVLSITTDSSNNVYVGGNFSSYAGTSGRNYLVKFNSSGVLDTTFMTNAVDGGKFSSIVYSIAIDSSNNVYVGGSFTSYAGTSGRSNLVKLSSSGVLDTTFMTSAVDGSKFSNPVLSIAIDSSNNVYVGGEFMSYAGTSGRNRLVKFSSSGTLDATFMANAVDGGKFNNVVYSIAVDSSNNVYVGGIFANYAGTSGRNKLVLLSSSGIVNSSFCANLIDTKFSNSHLDEILTLQAHSNKLFIGGNFAYEGDLSLISDNTVYFAVFSNQYIEYLTQGSFSGIYRPSTSAWTLNGHTFTGDNPEVNFSITPSGQLQYTSSNLSGTEIESKMKYKLTLL